MMGEYGRSRDLVPRIILVLAIVAYAIGFARISHINYQAFWVPSFDFAIFDQGAWLLSRFKDPFVTIRGLHLFGDHASFIILFFVPLYWLGASGEVLLYAQTLGLALGAVPVFLLGRRLLGNEWHALMMATAYLLTPAVGWLNMENFHPDAFEVPLLLFAVYFMVSRRWRLFMVSIVLVLLVKEDVPLVTIPLGIYVALLHNRRVGLATVATSALWLGWTVLLILPDFSGVDPGGLNSWRIPFGGVGGLVQTAIQSPWEVGGHILGAEKQRYLFQLLTPLAFLPLLSPFTLVALPVLGSNLISTFYYQYSIEYHYTAPLIPILWGGALLGISRIRRDGARSGLVALVLAGTVFSAYLWGPLSWSRKPVQVGDENSAVAEASREAIALIPPDAVVAARAHAASHLAHREKIYNLPNPWIADYWGDFSMEGERLPAADDVEYVLMLRGELSESSEAELEKLPEEGFEIVFEKDGIVLLERGAGTGSQSR